jgi:phytoene dehydrogenase-like protein
MTEFDVAVIGGGLGGLTTATLLARRGLAVALLERAHALGGRAATYRAQVKGFEGPFHFNQGAHALYRGGPAERLLGVLGVAWTGHTPPARGLAVLGERRFGLPATTGSFLSTGLLRWSAKIEQARLLARLGALDLASLASVPLSTWLARQVADPTLRATLEAFVRLTTFANAPDRLSAGLALQQLRRAQSSGVVYLDEGWQTLVDGATRAAEAAGVRIETGAQVVGAEPAGDGWRIRRADGLAADGLVGGRSAADGLVGGRSAADGLVGGRSAADVTARALVIAAGPGAAATIVASRALRERADSAIPQRIACLDVALRSLPDPRATFAVGVDRPLYLSVHSTSARLAPPGAALVSTMKYLSPDEAHDPVRDEAELESWLDRLQPGWRDVAVHRRSLPAMVASHAMPTAAQGGLPGRAGTAVPDAPGAFVVGDWVGPEGLLFDAVMASAEQAAVAAEAFLAARTVPRSISRGAPAARVA